MASLALNGVIALNGAIGRGTQGGGCENGSFWKDERLACHQKYSRASAGQMAFTSGRAEAQEYVAPTANHRRNTTAALCPPMPEAIFRRLVFGGKGRGSAGRETPFGAVRWGRLPGRGP